MGNLTILEICCLQGLETSALKIINFLEYHCSSDEFKSAVCKEWGCGNTIFHLAALNCLDSVILKLLLSGIPVEMNLNGVFPQDLCPMDDEYFHTASLFEAYRYYIYLKLI